MTKRTSRRRTSRHPSGARRPAYTRTKAHGKKRTSRRYSKKAARSANQKFAASIREKMASIRKLERAQAMLHTAHERLWDTASDERRVRGRASKGLNKLVKSVFRDLRATETLIKKIRRSKRS